MIWAVVPAKPGRTAKERLRGELSESERSSFALGMLGDVLAALGAVTRLRGIAVVTRDAAAQRLAAERSALVVSDPPGGGLNPAVAAGIAACVERGATAVLVAMGDLPLLVASDLDALLDHLPARGAVAAPSFDGTGTNLLALRPPALIATRFGPGSLAAHRRAAGAAGIALAEIALPSAALDVDTPEDLARLESAGAASLESLRVLRARSVRDLAVTGSRRGTAEHAPVPIVATAPSPIRSPASNL